MHARSAVGPRAAVTLLSLLGLLSAACTESAQHSFTFTSVAVPDKELVVANTRGALRLRAGAPGTAITGLVRVEAGGFESQADALEAARGVALVESGEAKDLRLDTRLPAEWARFDFTVVLDLTVPEDVRVTARTTEGRVILERLEVREVETTAQEIVLTQTTGDLVARTTAGGPIRVTSHDGDVDLRAIDGAITLEGLSGDVRALTTNAPIAGVIAPRTDGEAFIATTNAPISLVIDRRFGARLLATTTAPGVVTITHPDFRPTPSAPTQAEGTLGDGRGVLDLRTTAADIGLEAR